MTLKPRLSGFIATLLALLIAPSLSGQDVRREEGAKRQPSAKGSAPVAGTVHSVNAADLEAFFDGIVPLQISRDDIAGAVVAVVKDGRVLFEKGYGYADVKNKKPVSPQDTLFRPGSVSKLFTWTAVMQLVEQGKLDLDRDVNDYLDFQIPRTFPQPITMHNIMTHTSGFEESGKDLFVDKPEHLQSLRDYLATHVPRPRHTESGDGESKHSPRPEMLDHGNSTVTLWETPALHAIAIDTG